MLHVAKQDIAPSSSATSAGHLKQVEFNTFSCAGASHANKVADMHAYLDRSGAYPMIEAPVTASLLPKNSNIETLASCLALAHDTYGPSRSPLARQTAVLFVVQPNNVGFDADPLYLR